ncbi:mevalonate kinase [Streptomyces sp. S4.7]|uniref:phosphomevalonate kinase n=1 Tax=Streptomyces sp. S4.7 TaxID=2705439 RepID=UPI0013984C7C|nr:phosphomevalonate kinase [Streptomyces sp. S4.7]QHY93690.1 mevalonate kinase [Streptomyces sp. S4.7]
MTASRGTVVRRAPGKLFVAGEYAVVEPGNPAILVAVDRHVTVTATAARSGAADVVVSSDLGGRSVGWHWHDGRLVFHGAGDGRRRRETLAHVVSAIETVGRLLAERGLPVPPLDISVSSRLHENGRKFGLGSSGAVTVATVGAVAAFCGLRLPREDRFRLALLATAELDPKGSGGDLAASTWGGWIEYRAPDRTHVLDLARRLGVDGALRAPWPDHAVRRLPPPDGLSLEVGWTGNPASTASMVSALHRRTWRGTASHQKFVETTSDCVRSAVAALDTGDGPGLLHQIRRARQELARLDDEVGLGIFTPALTALCDTAEAVGGAAKPSGAGGGDCGIALLDAGAAREITHLRQRWERAGVLPLPVRPALEGTEE